MISEHITRAEEDMDEDMEDALPVRTADCDGDTCESCQ